MSDKIISVTHKVGGVLANATSMVFRDETAAFGVRRTDTLAIILASGVDLDNPSTGSYSKLLTGLVAGVPYEYWIERVYGGVTTRRQQFFVAGSTAASGVYADQGDIEDVFGIENVKKWSQLDNDVDEADLSRIQLSLNWSDSQIDNYFRGSRYAVPLVIGSGLATVTDWAAKLAGVWLYNSRGTRDENEEGNKLSKIEEAVRKDMARYKSGDLRLDAAIVQSQSPTLPSVVS